MNKDERIAELEVALLNVAYERRGRAGETLICRVCGATMRKRKPPAPAKSELEHKGGCIMVSIHARLGNDERGELWRRDFQIAELGVNCTIAVEGEGCTTTRHTCVVCGEQKLPDEMEPGVTNGGDHVALASCLRCITEKEQDFIMASIRLTRKLERENWLRDHFQEMLDSVEWLYPKARKEIHLSGPCVYAITAEDKMPGAIKIGSTVSLAQRTFSDKQEIGENPSVIAFAKTEQFRDFEEAIHMLLDDCVMYNSDWFERDRVIELLGIEASND